jgi:hypothetical protein
MGKNKHLKKLSASNTSSLIKVSTPPNYDNFKPAFSFREMKYQGNVCLSVCDDGAKAAIASKLLKLSQLTWGQILSLPRKKLGLEHIPYEEFKISLPPTVTKETTLLVFRFSDPGRIAGYRQQDIYHIVAVSSTHALY